MRYLFEVQPINAKTGKEHWVKVKADSEEEALEKVADSGQIAGEVRLAEVLEAEKEPGSCAKCGESDWYGGRSLLIWVGVVLFFPLGLLFLLVPPTWHCGKCGYSFSGPRPAGVPEETSTGYRLTKTFLYGILALGILIVVLAVAASLSGRR